VCFVEQRLYLGWGRVVFFDLGESVYRSFVFLCVNLAPRFVEVAV
jgi:hypothetical protein